MRDAATVLTVVSLVACINTVSAPPGDTGANKRSGTSCSIDISSVLRVRTDSSLRSLARLSTVSTDGEGRGPLWSTGA